MKCESESEYRRPTRHIIVIAVCDVDLYFAEKNDQLLDFLPVIDRVYSGICMYPTCILV